ncbi:MAG: 1-deoxy-D-xylulose-5-phosphate reductoisomerase, partial [Ruthenibacterium sp.]
MSKTITLLGSTGSIGTQSLTVIKMRQYTVFGLAAYHNVSLLLQQIAAFSPKVVCVVEENAAEQCEAELCKMAHAPQLLRGKDGLVQLAAMAGADIVLNAVVGIAGLAATLAAIESGKDVALANKESLVTGGRLVTEAVKKYGVHLLPVDSEHSAIFQCLQ